MSLWRLIIVSSTVLLSLASGSFENDDFRYMSHHGEFLVPKRRIPVLVSSTHSADLLTTASRFYDQNVTTYSRFHFDETQSLMFVGARYVKRFTSALANEYSPTNVATSWIFSLLLCSPVTILRLYHLRGANARERAEICDIKNK
jgi:hypothetical protein